MKRLFFIAAAAVLWVSCLKSDDYKWIKKGIDTAEHQVLVMAGELQKPGIHARGLKNGEYIEKPTTSWTSGFYPGTLWYVYEFTGNEDVKREAVKHTGYVFPIREYKKTHDLGFMIYCSYGNAMRLSPSDTIPAVLIKTAETLCERYDETIGCIRSWDFGKWNFPVIIDNMMNLELLFKVAELTGDNKYRDISIRHANTTLSNHFRADKTCWHVISYNNDGTIESKGTHQGYSDNSSWARGQGWAVYGYTLMFRETADSTYLSHAAAIADMIMGKVTTDDAIPYWDYDAPVSDNTPRDASAAAVSACAFLQLSTYLEDGQKYFDYAEKILKSLSSEKYLSAKGANKGFILLHSTGNLPGNEEVDSPLIYADYYYLEGLKIYMELKGLKYSDL